MRPVHPAPSAQPMLIGARLRSTRRAQGLTIDQVAEATGLTKGFISRVERDATSPSVATLVTLCQVLSLPIGSLFDAPVHEVITLDAAPRINMGGTGADERMLTPRSEARVQVLRSRLEAGATGGAEMYTINCDVEVLHVLSGSVVLHLTGEDIALQAGDTVTFSGQEPHNWSNPGDTVAEVMWTIAPAAWSGSS
ncbi:transcriptional regulator with XRE-family HTH domain [Lysinibacter cavernae]|uniref:Transcriptional regulator with XRE-family HTH domain n=2 Tax=Lysinibacter cavernae TaxID=1640652 RepID=A0A7X5QYJ7_9MICO|nr:transcriptional regulator with XRE-family HTH domain [Lysinibacter cavernae]